MKKNAISIIGSLIIVISLIFLIIPKNESEFDLTYLPEIESNAFFVSDECCYQKLGRGCGSGMKLYCSTEGNDACTYSECPDKDCSDEPSLCG